MTSVTMDCEMAPETAADLSGPLARSILAKLARRVERRRWARPGGAAREATYEIRNDRGELIEITLPAMRDGGSVRVVHHFQAGSLHSGRILRVPDTVLPDTILLSAPGRRLGELVDMGDTGVPSLADAVVVDVFDTDHRGQALLFHTSAATIRPTIETD